MKNTKGFLLAEAVPKILIAVLCAVVLIVLISKLYGVYGAKSNERLAAGELDNLIATANQVVMDKKEYASTFTTVQNWVLVSYEFGDFCKGKFCLCLCEKVDCSGFYACRPTDKFFILKDKDGFSKRFLTLDSPEMVKLSYYDEKAYPFNVDGIIKQASLYQRFTGVIFGEIVVQQVLPLFFKYEGAAWKWTTTLPSWMSLNEGSDLLKDAEGIKNFLDYFSGKTVKNDEQAGITTLQNLGAKESEGFIIISRQLSSANPLTDVSGTSLKTLGSIPSTTADVNSPTGTNSVPTSP